MSIFKYLDYKIWMNDLIQSMPKGGRGQFSKIAKHLNVSPVIVTQVFKGDREITPEQAIQIADYLGLKKIELDYLILLVNHARAGSFRYKTILLEEIHELRKKGQDLKSHVHQETQLNEHAKSILYSNWFYLAIWSLVAIPDFDNVQVLAERLNLSRKKTQEAVNFLLDHQLLILKNEKLEIGPKLVHLEATSMHIARHHQNWRLQAFKNYDRMKPSDLGYTAPVTLSQSDALIVRERLVKFISETVSLIKDSPSEEAFCLCIDWFGF